MTTEDEGFTLTELLGPPQSDLLRGSRSQEVAPSQILSGRRAGLATKTPLQSALASHTQSGTDLAGTGNRKESQ